MVSGSASGVPSAAPGRGRPTSASSRPTIRAPRSSAFTEGGDGPGQCSPDHDTPLLMRSMVDSVPLMMAVFAAFLLLFQLQPLVGTVACLRLSDRPAKQECKMPEHGSAATTSITVSGAPAQPCEVAVICTPARPAIPTLSNRFDIAVPLYEGSAILAATLPLGIPPAPPFRP